MPDNSFAEGLLKDRKTGFSATSFFTPRTAERVKTEGAVKPKPEKVRKLGDRLNDAPSSYLTYSLKGERKDVCVMIAPRHRDMITAITKARNLPKVQVINDILDELRNQPKSEKSASNTQKSREKKVKTNLTLSKTNYDMVYNKTRETGESFAQSLSDYLDDYAAFFPSTP